jgi:ADP-dependent phosphofructokinase/glucokinase
MLALLHPGLLLAEEKGCVPASEARPRGARRPEIFIFEYTAGRAIGDFVPTRSSRIIVRFHDPGLEHDPQFDTLSLKFASTAGAGVISGFNAVPRHRLDAEIERVRALAGKWRGAGLAVVHLELAGYDTAEARDMVLEGMRGTITSIGMSHSEFLALQPGHAELAEAMCELGRRLRVTRVCVHADDWAASVIQGDPEKEREALAMGCLLAGTRAAKGVPSYPRHIDPRATFATPPAEKTNMQGGWSFVACPSPHLDHPVATVGLGDSFTGGCLLILGHQPARAETLAAADRTATSA